jgi:hypothetical protein
METDIEIIEKAKASLQPITYKAEIWGYFVKHDDVDMGNEDYCRKCIPNAVKEAKASYLKERQKIIDKYNEIEQTGMFKGNQIKGVYSDERINNSKNVELEDYPANAKFSFEAHDPDFGGGLTEPLCCPSCGRYFETGFIPDLEESKQMLEDYDYSKRLTPRLKYILDHVFFYYEHLGNDEKEIFLTIAKRVLKHK